MVRPLLLGLVILLTLGLLPLGGFYLLFAPRGEIGCEPRHVFVETLSPDGSWVARFYQNVCGGFGTYIGDTVEIARPDEAPHPAPTAGVVFEMAEPSYGQPRPMTLKWLSERELEVTIPNDVWAGRQQSTFNDLAISYRYTPDDPIERVCLAQWRSLQTDEMVRRNLSPTENAKAFLAKCEADIRPR